MPAVLLDSGVMFALFDHDEDEHERYKQVTVELTAQGVRIATTWACVTEASYFLSPKNHYALLEWLERGGATVHNHEAFDLEEMTAWLRQYSERGKSIMDFADATLYWLAVQLGTNVILTVDQKDFSRYKLPDGKKFEIV